MVNQSLKEKYNFSDFTERHYRKLLKIAKKKYDFEFFHTNNKSHHVLWRHDVDFSAHRALRLAEIEHELDVKSTFFFRIHGEFYNIFEQPTYKKIQKIISLGHEIGIHFEYFFYDNIKSKSVLDQKLKFEKNILEKTFNVKIKAFSFHNPEMKNALRINENKLVGMINTYGKSIKKKYHYCSDSMGYWRFERLEDVLLSNIDKNLHVLTDPEWWQKTPMSPSQRFQRCVEKRADFCRATWKAPILNHKRMNEVWKGKW